MSNLIQATSFVRQRGQLTIPDSIRGKTEWVKPGSAIVIARTKADEIVIKPYPQEKREIDWDKLWEKIKLARSFKGKYKGSLSRFIAKDRETRR